MVTRFLFFAMFSFVFHLCVQYVKYNTWRAVKFDIVSYKTERMPFAAKSYSSDKLAYVFYDKNMNKKNWSKRWGMMVTFYFLLKKWLFHSKVRILKFNLMNVLMFNHNMIGQLERLDF